MKDLKGSPAALISQYRDDPAKFCEDILRTKPVAWQREMMCAVSDARAGRIPQRRIAIRSGVGVGKTAGVSMLILWHLACYPDSKVPCTAPTAPQLKAVLWPELRKWITAIPQPLRPFFPYEWTGDQIRYGETNFAVARTAREETPEAFQGLHARHIMLVIDEASGVPESIFMAAQGVMSSEGAVTVLIGNPTRLVGSFYDAFHSKSELYWSRKVSAFDSPMVTQSFVDEMRAAHDEGSYEYTVRVLGDFYHEDGGVIVPKPWVDEAVERDVEPDTDYIVWGVDVSNGRDKTAISKRKGNVLLEPPISWGGKEVNASVQIVADIFWRTPAHMQPAEIVVESAGMGVGFAQRLRDLLERDNTKVTLCNVHVRPKSDGKRERYASHRVELWALAREWFESRVVRIPAGCDTFIRQISSVEWETHERTGLWVIPDKSVDGQSPDEADSFVLTFGGRRGDRRGFTSDTARVNMTQTAYAIGSASYLQQGTAPWQI